MKNNRQGRSRPSAGKTMVGLVKQFGSVIHELNEQLAKEISNSLSFQNYTNWKEQILTFRYLETDAELLERHKPHLISSTLLSNLICATIIKQHLPTSACLKAEKGFFSSEHVDFISEHITAQTQSLISSRLGNILPQISIDMLPYLFEVFETGLETAEASGADRVKKKNNGIYYTPSDVIEFIIRRSLINKTKSVENSTWYDPAVGTGAFLIGVIQELCKDKKIDQKFIATNLYGTDISPFALQSACFLIAINYVAFSGLRDHSQEILKNIGENLVLYNATKITTKERLTTIFPNLDNEGFDFIISNPPYSKRRHNQLAVFASEENRIASEEMYHDFLRILFECTIDGGGGGMVVPLSLTYNSNLQFRSLRKFIQSRSGIVEFWNFDRTPDSLFGDDVKTRNTIVIYDVIKAQTPIKVRSTYLHRWNSRNREGLFKSISSTSLESDVNLENGIPKVGDEIGANLLSRLLHLNGSLSQIINTSQTAAEIAIKSTAYNWISVEITNDARACVGKNFWTVKREDVSPEMVYAVLNSRLTYWLWRVWSDGFHLNKSITGYLPFGNDFFNKVDKHKLSKLGLELWENVQSQKVVTLNAGIESHSFCPLQSEQLISEIDKIVLHVLEISEGYVQYLKTLIDELILAGRESELNISKKLKYLKLNSKIHVSTNKINKGQEHSIERRMERVH